MAKPFVKWAGGKSRLVPELLARAPGEIRTYVEPFAGGAALFFALSTAVDAAVGGGRSLEGAILADQNAELVACYRAVKEEVSGVIDALRAYRYDRDLFYETRALDTRGMSNVERAARLIFLNRTCFNGLWRVNSDGKFNVPFGRYKNPRILDEPNLRNASRALARATILSCDFLEATKHAGERDFVYFDPPYVPLTKTAMFTDYVVGGFGPQDQERLVAELRRLRDKGVLAMLSNADTPETRDLYKDFAVHIVKVPRPINSDPTKRGDAREVMVTSWGIPGVYRASASASPRKRTG